jgi:arabinogalactan oligomer / maltooligosaccharide transport system substrate-binding protein
MRRTAWTVFILTLVVSLSLAACGGEQPIFPATTAPTNRPTLVPIRQPTPLPTPTEQVIGGTLSIWHSWDEASMPALVQIISEFQQQYPDVLFDVLYVPAEDLQRRFAEETRNGSGPTLLLGPAEWGPPLYDDGLIENLSGLVSSERLAALNQPALGGGIYADATIGLPVSLQGVVLYRNKDIITITASTFDELVTLAQTSTQGEVIGAILERGFFYSGGHLEGVGGQLMDRNYQPAFNDARGLAWIEMLSRFTEAGPPNDFSDQDLERFKEGKVGWIIDGTWNMRNLAAAIGPEKLAIDPWPGYEDGRMSGYVMAENVYLSDTAAPETRPAAIRFIDYLLSPQAQTHLAEVERIPSVSGVSITDPITGPLISGAMAALAGGATYPPVPQTTYYNTNLEIALRSIFTDGVEPAQALQTAEEAILSDLQTNFPTPTPNP